MTITPEAVYALRAAAAEILADCANSLALAHQNVERGIDPELATVRVRLALLDRLAEAADLFHVEQPADEELELEVELEEADEL